MKRYKKRFQTFWMNTDHKPKGDDRRYIEKQDRQEARRECDKMKKLEEALRCETRSESGKLYAVVKKDK